MFKHHTLTVWTSMLITLAALLAQGCSPRKGAARYTPLFASAIDAAKRSPAGTIGADFAHAGSAPTLDEAARRWEAFLRDHPPGGESEDAVQKRYIDAAVYELVRVSYLLGRRHEGDELLQAADPLRLK
jgi:hypothetical protein